MFLRKNGARNGEDRTLSKETVEILFKPALEICTRGLKKKKKQNMFNSRHWRSKVELFQRRFVTAQYCQHMSVRPLFIGMISIIIKIFNCSVASVIGGNFRRWFLFISPFIICTFLRNTNATVIQPTPLTRSTISAHDSPGPMTLFRVNNNHYTWSRIVTDPVGVLRSH